MTSFQNRIGSIGRIKKNYKRKRSCARERGRVWKKNGSDLKLSGLIFEVIEGGILKKEGMRR